MCRLLAFATFIVGLAGAVASAQTTVPSPPSIPYGPAVTLDVARKAADAAMAEAKKNNWTMAVAVVDSGGVMVFYEKMDNTQIGSTQVAIEKALTSVRFKRPSKVFQDLIAGGGLNLRMLKLTGAAPFEGGIPLIADGKIIGAIGVSGDSTDHDGICAQAGANAVK